MRMKLVHYAPEHVKMDMEHQMDYDALQNYQDITSKYWEARKRMGILQLMPLLDF